jgi:hypothetical protein
MIAVTGDTTNETRELNMTPMMPTCKSPLAHIKLQLNKHQATARLLVDWTLHPVNKVIGD